MEGRNLTPKSGDTVIITHHGDMISLMSNGLSLTDPSSLSYHEWTQSSDDDPDVLYLADSDMTCTSLSGSDRVKVTSADGVELRIPTWMIIRHMTGHISDESGSIEWIIDID